MSELVVITNGPEQTAALAARVAEQLPSGAVVALQGDLGTGKTVFARGIARGLGIREPLTSPTFAVLQEYPRPDGGWLFHADMYRIEPTDTAGTGIEEYLFDPDGVTVVEWAERIEGILAPCRAHGDTRLLDVRLEHAGDDRRRLVLRSAVALRMPGDDRLSVGPVPE